MSVDELVRYVIGNTAMVVAKSAAPGGVHHKDATQPAVDVERCAEAATYGGCGRSAFELLI